MPFLNTMILLLSGCTVTWAHHCVREGDNRTATKALALTVLLGILFTSLQAYEYIHTIYSPEGFTLSSGIFGSTFYMATGFHGFHVMIGTTFLIVCTFRAAYNHFRPDKHVGWRPPPGTGTSSTWSGCSCSPGCTGGAAISRPRRH